MTYFKLDIPKLSENLENYKYYKKNCLEDIYYLYNNYKDVDAVWNDLNSSAFIRRVKDDKYKLDEYFDYLDSLYDEIDKFKRDIESALKRQDYRQGCVLKYDDSNLENCKSYLGSAIAYLNSSLDYLYIYAFSSFSSMFLIYNLRFEIGVLKTKLQNLLNSIDEFSRGVNNALIESMSSRKRIAKVNLDLKPIEYSWRITDADLKKHEAEKVIPVSSFNTKDIEVKSQDLITGLTNDVTDYGLNENKIETKAQKDIEGLTNDLDYYESNENRIKTENQKDIEGLTNDLDYYESNENRIKAENQKDIEGLAKNIEETNFKENKMDELKELNKENLFKDISSSDDAPKSTEMFTGENKNVTLNSIKEYDGQASKISLSNSSTVNLGDIKAFDGEQGSSLDGSSFSAGGTDLSVKAFDGDLSSMHLESSKNVDLGKDIVIMNPDGD